MDFSRALHFIYHFKDYERDKKKYRLDLTSFKKFLRKIGSPEKIIKNPILVAGTTGKGSVSTTLASILQEKGKTGLFTSPHLINTRERIRIDGVPIKGEEFAGYVEFIKPYVTEERTTFELLTAIAFLYFGELHTDFSVFEVGLGGRLDSTNVLTPVLSIITPVGIDHTAVLGKGIQNITKEKLGIVRENIPLILAPQIPGVYRVIKAMNHKSIRRVGKDIKAEWAESTIDSTRFQVNGVEYTSSFRGPHQVENGLTAILAARTLGINDSTIKKGIRKARIRGRFDIIRENPYVILDGAHNVISIKLLTRAIRQLVRFRRLWLVIAVLADKNIDGIAWVLSTITDYCIATGVKSERASNPEVILHTFTKMGIPGEIVNNSIDAFRAATSKAREDDLVLITGSFYLVGEIMENIEPFIG